jgi:hypothetical protein
VRNAKSIFDETTLTPKLSCWLLINHVIIVLISKACSYGGTKTTVID